MRHDHSDCIFMPLRSFAVVYPAVNGKTDQKKDRATMAVRRRSELVPIVEDAAGSLGYQDL